MYQPEPVYEILVILCIFFKNHILYIYIHFLGLKTFSAYRIIFGEGGHWRNTSLFVITATHTIASVLLSKT